MEAALAMRSFLSNAVLGYVVVVPLVVLMIAHEALAAMADGQTRFVVARRRLTVTVVVLSILLAVAIIARFYYLRV
jgi:hypothetical protein